MLFAALALAWAPAAALPSQATLVVLNKSDDTASLIDPETGATRHLVPTGAGPHEVAVSADGSLAVVADYGARTPGNTLTLIDVASGEVVGKVDLGEHRRPHGLVFLGESMRVLATSETRRALIEVDMVEGRVVRALPTDQDASHMVAVTPDGARAFVANIGSGSVSVIDLTTGERLANVPTGAGCEGIDVSPGGGEVWTANREAGTVSVIDARSLEVLATLEAPGFPIRVKLTPDGGRALVSCARAGELAVFDTGTRALVERLAMRLRAAEGSEEHLFADAFGESPAPIGIQIRPDGRRAYVANSSANRVVVVDLDTLETIRELEAGEQPDGLGWATR